MRKILASLLVTAALAAPAAAGRPPDPDIGWNPPARFDHPYAGHIAYNFVDVWGILDNCGNGPVACSIRMGPPGRPCQLFIPKIGEVSGGFRITAKGQRNLIRHEIGHCNGWPGDHPA